MAYIVLINVGVCTQLRMAPVRGANQAILPFAAHGGRGGEVTSAMPASLPCSRVFKYRWKSKAGKSGALQQSGHKTN